MEIGGQLCLTCGLCCDGTLFDGVRLEAGDDPKRLKALGLPITGPHARMPVARFAQPCAALCADCTCKVYANRPAQCRVFECGVYKRVQAGETPLDTALRTVKQARRLAVKIRRLLRQLGDHDEQRALGERFFRMQCRMEADDTDDEARSVFADLSLAVHRLKLLAHDKFYTRPPGDSDDTSPLTDRR